MSESPFVSIGTERNFVELAMDKSYSTPVLVDFWADWCAPCRELTPILEKLAEEYRGAFHLLKINTDEQQLLAQQLAVRSLPTVKLFKGGRVVDEFMGALPESAVRQFLDPHLKDDLEQFLEQVDQLLERGEREHALAALEQAMGQVRDNTRIALKIAALKIEERDRDGARALLDALSEEARQSPEAKSVLAKIELAEKLSDLPDEAALRRRVERNPADSEARDRLSAVLYARDDVEGAMEQLLEIVRRDRAYGDDGGRLQLIKLFEALGGDNPLVQEYRRKLAGLLN